MYDRSETHLSTFNNILAVLKANKTSKARFREFLLQIFQQANISTLRGVSNDPIQSEADHRQFSKMTKQLEAIHRLSMSFNSQEFQTLPVQHSRFLHTDHEI